MSNRAKFANTVCKLLYKSHDGKIEDQDFITELKELRKHFENHVRNIYEEVKEIPLFLYCDFLECTSPDDIYVSEYEDLTLEEIITDLIKKSHEYYSA